jgi:hypothetical protein
VLAGPGTVGGAIGMLGDGDGGRAPDAHAASASDAHTGRMRRRVMISGKV